MSHQAPTRSAPPPGTIDFELTDIADARTAHDQLPPGVAEVGHIQPGYWEQRRRKPLATDRALTGQSLEWLMTLPPPLRPRALCDRFPRIVNSVSAAWGDDRASVDVFEHLLNDRRKGRRGFPMDVQREIELLCMHRIEMAQRRP
jgi:hypothetical protein